MHKELLYNAILAELSYKTNARTSPYNRTVAINCPTDSSNSPTPTPNTYTISIRHIDHSIFEAAKKSVETQNDRRRIWHTTVRRRIGGRREREIHYRCNDNTPISDRFTMAMQWAEANGNVGLMIRIGYVVGATIVYTEDLRLVEIPDPNHSGTFLGVPGINPTNMNNFFTAIQALQNNSCLLDFALEVATHFFRTCPESAQQASNRGYHGVIVGHSLGGIAAEYIASTRAFIPILRECNSGNIPTTFRVFSYNSLGWERNHTLGNINARIAAQEQIHSIRIDGELLETQFPNRRYLGHVIRYPSPDRECEKLCRHRITTMQKAIFLCSNCTGQFSYHLP